MSTLHKKLYDQVFDAILGGVIAPGTRLAEVALADLYGVSRSVVRRTLQRLCDEGIVDIRQNRGATVNSVTPRTAREVFEARRVVELGVVELVSGRLSSSQARALRETCAEERRAMESGDRARGLRLSAEFHLQLARATGNELLVGYANNLMSRSALAIACLERRTPIHCAFGEHPRLVDSIAAGDVGAARELMDRHLEHIAANLDLDGEDAALERLVAS